MLAAHAGTWLAGLGDALRSAARGDAATEACLFDAARCVVDRCLWREESGERGKDCCYKVVSLINLFPPQHRCARLAPAAPTLRRDVATPAGRLATLALGKFTDEGGPPPPAAAAALVVATLDAFPAALRAAAPRLRAWALPTALTPGPHRHLAAAVLARSHRCSTAPDAWTEVAGGALATAAVALDDALAGVDDPDLAAASKAALVPGVDPWPWTGDATFAAVAAMDVVERVLGVGADAPVRVPAEAIVALAARCACATDPRPRGAGLALLTALLTSVPPSSLAADAASAARCVGDAARGADAARRAADAGAPAAAERCALYVAVAAAACVVGTVGAAALAPLVTPLLQADVVGPPARAADATAPAAKRRKKSAAADDDAAQPLPPALASGGGDAADLAPRVAAAGMDAAAALLRAAGAALAPRDRAALDALAARAAVASADAPPSTCDTDAVSSATLRAASLRALTAAVLAPAAARPPHAALAAVLLADAAFAPVPSVAAAGRDGIAALDGLLHPRSVPVVAGGTPDGGAVELVEAGWGGASADATNAEADDEPSPPPQPQATAQPAAPAPAPPAAVAAPAPPPPPPVAPPPPPPPPPPAAAPAVAEPPAVAYDDDDDDASLPSIDSGGESE